jgi:hypothetical protein
MKDTDMNIACTGTVPVRYSIHSTTYIGTLLIRISINTVLYCSTVLLYARIIGINPRLDF